MSLPEVIVDLIFSYCDETALLDWIDEKKLNWVKLSTNESAIHMLEKNLNKVDWERLSKNPNAIHILEKNLDKVDWEWLSMNKNIFKRDERVREILMNV